MPQIQDVPTAASLPNRVMDGPGNRFRRGEKHARVNIALDSGPIPNVLPELPKIHAPVHAENVRSGPQQGTEQMIRRLGEENYGASPAASSSIRSCVAGSSNSRYVA